MALIRWEASDRAIVSSTLAFPPAPPLGMICRRYRPLVLLRSNRPLLTFGY